MSADTLLNNKRLVWEFQKKLSTANAMNLGEIVNEYLHEDVVWHGPHPINELTGVAALVQQFWKPFIKAFPDFERHNDIFLGGSFKDAEWISCSGHYVAIFANDWLNIPASGQLITIRFGEFCRIQNGKIVEMYVMLDMLDVMRQINLWPISRGMGIEGWWPKPHVTNSLIVKPQEPAESRKTSKLIANWIDEQKQFDSTIVNLQLMRHEEYFHPQCLMYGSSGIGANRGIEGLKENYQKPMLSAFSEIKCASHQTHFAEGSYMAASGWESFKGVHNQQFLGIEPTHKQVRLRVMEWWRRSGDLIKESWMMVDLVDLFLQMELDVFAKMHDVQHQDQWL